MDNFFCVQKDCTSRIIWADQNFLNLINAPKTLLHSLDPGKEHGEDDKQALESTLPQLSLGEGIGAPDLPGKKDLRNVKMTEQAALTAEEISNCGNGQKVGISVTFSLVSPANEWLT